MNKKKQVYVAMAVDVINEGHINILKKASSLGEVTVGLLTDDAIASYKSIPLQDYNRRKSIIQNIKFVNKVVPQYTLDYVTNLNLIKPNFVVHGDDWKNGVQKKLEKELLRL